MKKCSELWPKEFGKEPVTFAYPLNLTAQNRKQVTQNSEKKLPLKSDGCSTRWTRLGAGGFYRAISKVFRIGKSTIQTIY